MREAAHVRPATAADVAAWLTLRAMLWGEEAADPDEVRPLLDDGGGFVALVGGQVAGIAEASVRRDHVNGCDTSPVLFLEGLFVAPGHRRRGVERALVAAVADWGRARSCAEFASDAAIDNAASHALHRALGFEETERVVYFRRRLDPRG